MTNKQPWDYQSALTAERLNIIAGALLDVFYDVEQELDTPLDDNYTRGTTTFGRQKNQLIKLCRSGKHVWLDLRNTSNDLTCAIEGIPFRFFSDDPEKPSKPGFWRRNEQDNLFPSNDGEPIYWRFVVEKPLTDDGEASVYFLGANSNQELICVWKHSEKVRVLKAVDTSRPAPVEMPEPVVGLPKQDQLGNDEANKQ